ncbi:MAG: hypothetical protein NT040_16965 [Bacteroidetes bacterium]|nr:hypothetical protein [Bacteroidota bacterium]
MKNTFRIALTGIILLAMFIAVDGCKKKTEDPVPTFTMSYDSVPITSGGKGLQFFATCTNNGVTMVKVTLTTPQDSLYLYNYSGGTYAKNSAIPMQGSNQAYTKIKGTWKLSLVGNSSGGTAFTYDATVAVNK